MSREEHHLVVLLHAVLRSADAWKLVLVLRKQACSLKEG